MLTVPGEKKFIHPRLSFQAHLLVESMLVEANAFGTFTTKPKTKNDINIVMILLVEDICFFILTIN